MSVRRKRQTFIEYHFDVDEDVEELNYPTFPGEFYSPAKDDDLPVARSPSTPITIYRNDIHKVYIDTYIKN